MYQSRFFILMLIALGIGLSGCGENKISDDPSVSVTAELDTTSATIGDIILYSVTVENPGDYMINFPAISDSADFEVREKSVTQSELTPSVEFQIVPWDTGIFTIPEYSVLFLHSDSSLAFSMSTNELKLIVNSVLDQENPGELHPLKEPVPVSPPIPWRFIFLISAFLILLISAIWLWKQRIPPVIIPPQVYDPTVPPSAIALEKLASLDTNGDSKTFYVGLSYALREFVENSLYIKALEMTTKELSEYRQWIHLSGDLFDSWIDILSRADMVKYAKGESLPKQKQLDLDWGKQFVQQAFEE